MREAATWPVQARATGSGGRAGASAAVPDPVPRGAPAQALTRAVLTRTCHIEPSWLSPAPLRAGH